MSANCPACGHPFSCMQHTNSSAKKCVKCNPPSKVGLTHEEMAQVVRALGVTVEQSYEGGPQWWVEVDGMSAIACWYGSKHPPARVRLLVKTKQRLPWVAAKGKCVRINHKYGRWNDRECHPECVGSRIAQEINRRMWEKYMKSW